MGASAKVFTSGRSTSGLSARAARGRVGPGSMRAAGAEAVSSSDAGGSGSQGSRGARRWGNGTEGSRRRLLSGHDPVGALRRRECQRTAGSPCRRARAVRVDPARRTSRWSLPGWAVDGAARGRSRATPVSGPGGRATGAVPAPTRARASAAGPSASDRSLPVRRRPFDRSFEWTRHECSWVWAVRSGGGRVCRASSQCRAGRRAE